MASISIRNRIILGAVLLWADTASEKARNSGQKAVDLQGDIPPFKKAMENVSASMNRVSQ